MKTSMEGQMTDIAKLSAICVLIMIVPAHKKVRVGKKSLRNLLNYVPDLIQDI